MICPFRLSVIYEYEKVGTGSYLTTEQREEFPPCVEEECPYYDYHGTCMRLDDDD